MNLVVTTLLFSFGVAGSAFAESQQSTDIKCSGVQDKSNSFVYSDESANGETSESSLEVVIDTFKLRLGFESFKLDSDTTPSGFEMRIALDDTPEKQRAMKIFYTGKAQKISFVAIPDSIKQIGKPRQDYGTNIYEFRAHLDVTNVSGKQSTKGFKRDFTCHAELFQKDG